MKNLKRNVLGITGLVMVLQAASPVCAFAGQLGSDVLVEVEFEDSVYAAELSAYQRGDYEVWSQLYNKKCIDLEKAPVMYFQAGNGAKEAGDWTENYWRGSSEESPMYESGGKYYNSSETLTWAPETVITISDVQIPEGYVADEASGVYTVIFTQEDYERVQGVNNGTIPQDGDAVKKNVTIFIHKAAADAYQ